MKKLLSIAVFAVFSASSAISASLTPSVGVSYNNAGYAAEGIERTFTEAGATDKTTDDEGAFAANYGSIFLELGVGELLAFGVDYVVGDIETPTNTSREGATKSTVSAKFKDLTTVYAKMNIPFLNGTYVKAGYSQVDVDVNESMASGNTYADVDTEGYMAGIGYNHELTSGLSIRLEATASIFEDVKTDNGIAAGSGTPANGGRNEVTVESMWGAKGTLSLVKTF